MNSRYLYSLSERSLPPSIRQKAANLALLASDGFRIPETWVIGWEAYERYVSGDQAVCDQVLAELTAALPAHGRYAVRSSADVEDAALYSFAGQFCSQLHVSGAPALSEAIRAVWDSAHAPGVRAYMQRLPPGTALPRMAVMVQPMITPLLSRVAFSRNPLNGADETMIEAVRGTGDALVQRGATPERWIWRGFWRLQGVTAADAPLMRRIAEQTRQIAEAFGMPVDLEWVFDGQAIAWLQARPIRPARSATLSSNTIAREQLPGMIKPLIWSVNVPTVNSAWVRVLTELIGPNRLEPHSLAKQFYYRAYYNMGAFGEIFERLDMPRDALEIMMGAGKSASKQMYMRAHVRMLLVAPRVFGFMLDKVRFARTIDRFLPEAELECRAIAALPAERFQEHELFAAIDRLKALIRRLAYFNIIGPLLMQMYARLFHGRLANLGLTPEDVELFEDPAVLEPYNPTSHLARLRGMLDALEPDVREQVVAGGLTVATAIPQAQAFCAALRQVLAQFGHLSTSGNDFLVAPWCETPDLIIRMAANHRVPDPNRRRIKVADLPVRGPRRVMLHALAARTRAFRLYRERISSLYTFAYGLCRVFFLAGRFLDADNLRVREIVLVDRYAEEHEIELGKSIELITPNGPQRFKVVGLMAKEGPGQLNNGAFAVVPLQTAQEVFNRAGMIDQIDIVVRPEQNNLDALDALKGVLQQALGADYSVTYPAMQGRRMAQMLNNYQIGLNFMSGMSLFVGAFLIYNAFSMTVVERTREFGFLRTVGYDAPPGDLAGAGRSGGAGAAGGGIGDRPGVVVGAGAHGADGSVAGA